MRSLFQEVLGSIKKRGILWTFGAGIEYGGKLGRDIIEFIYKDRIGAKQYNVSLSTRVRAWRHGFCTRSWCWLNLDENDPSTYINNIYASRTLYRVNGMYDGVFDDKVAFHNSSEKFKEYLPNYYGTISQGSFKPHYEEKRSFSTIVSDEKVVLKPICGSQGDGIKILDQGNCLNKQTKNRVQNLHGYIVTEYISQHEYAKSIAPFAVNTIRMYTLVDPISGEPNIVRATHRFGTRKSAPTDNWSKGAICAPVNINSGVIKEVINQGTGRSIEKIRTHPETDMKITGLKVPYWEKTKKLIIDLANHHNRAPYVGWDVAIGKEGPIVIEANGKSGINLLQISNGLLENDDAVRFVENVSVY